MPASSNRPLREVVVVFAIVATGTAILGLFRSIAWIGNNLHLAVAAWFVLIAYRMAGVEEGGTRRYGIDLGGIAEPSAESEHLTGLAALVDFGRVVVRTVPSALREAAFAGVVALIVFPPFALAFYLWHGPAHRFHLSLPPDLPALALAQFVVIAFPEEALFRGYMQTHLEEAFASRKRLLGTWVSPGAIVIQASLFALVHLTIEPHPAKLAVFFPGLLFGWIRARRNGIGAAIVLHALSNLYSETIVRSWL